MLFSIVAAVCIPISSAQGFLFFQICACVHATPVVSDSATYRLQPARLLSPQDSPGKNTGGSCHFLLQRILPAIEPMSLMSPALICGFFFFFYHHILASIFYLVLLKSHSNRCKVIAHCVFDLYFFDDQVILSRFNFFNLYKCIIIEGRKTTTKNSGVTMWSCIHKAVGRKMNKGHKQMTHKVRLTSQQTFEKNFHSYQ